MENDRREIFFENIVTNISDGILAIDLDGMIFFANPSAERIMGIPAEFLQGSKISSLLMDNDDNDEFFQCILDAIYDKKTIDAIVPFNQNRREARTLTGSPINVFIRQK